MKIRLDSGTILDVDHELRLASAADQWKLAAVLQALHSALSVPKRDEWDGNAHITVQAMEYNNALRRVRQAAGVVEEEPG